MWRRQPSPFGRDSAQQQAQESIDAHAFSGRFVLLGDEKQVPGTTRCARLLPPWASRTCVCLSILASISAPAWPQQKSGDLTNASLEDLMNIEVVSVTKTEQKLSRTASAVFVVTQEDIRRSGALNIPDLLRMVPGIDVAQIDANTWAISARGFNARFANEMFVMVDGRSVYTDTFGGVFWDVLNLPLDDIERIEVIRGPGGSVWGANAVNGVVNIVTKKASETRGVLLTSGGGNVQQGFGTVQYGGNLGDSTQFRAYTSYFNSNHFPGISDVDGGDGWHSLQGGFRTDSSVTSKDNLAFQGVIYVNREGQPSYTLPSVTTPTTIPIELRVNLDGGFVEGTWNRQYSPHSDTTLQFSYDQYERNDQLRDARRTFDLTFQHHLRIADRHDLVWGLEFRDSSSSTDGNLFISLVPPVRHTQLYGMFAQDDISMLDDQLHVMLGTKLEDNYYTGFNLMPSARAAWMPTRNQTLWAAVSDAVRSPADLDTGIRAGISTFREPDGTPAVVTLTGNPKLDDEALIAYELGYRRLISDRLSLDFAAYYNNYRHQETFEPAAPFLVDTPAPSHFVVPILFANLMHGETHGLEAAANWKVTNRWSLSSGYAFEEIHMRLAPGSHDTTSVSAAQGSSPDHSTQLRSHLILPHGLSWDSSAYFVDRLTDPIVPAYTRVDSGLAWHFAEGARLSVFGQNLVRDHHMEFVDTNRSIQTTLTKRGVYAELSWQF